MSSARRLVLAVAAGLACAVLSACGHKDLTAPCSASAGFGAAYASDCGDLKPINPR